MAEYIEREAALREIERREALMVGDKRVSVDAMKSFIKNRPDADVAPVRHGRWIASHDEFCACSICKYPVYAGWNQTNHCPNCGAKMDGGGGDAAD